MIVLGLYLPKLGSLIAAVLVLTMIGLFLSFYAILRFRLPTYKTPILIFSGGVFVFFVLVLKNSDVNMGNYGDITRELTNTIHSDALLALIEMMDVGWGKFYVMGGMLSGLVAASLLKTRTDNAA
jgi:RsiW-degrading membrane proteinase PrsW (M82 family)